MFQYGPLSSRSSHALQIAVFFCSNGDVLRLAAHLDGGSRRIMCTHLFTILRSEEGVATA